MLDLYKDVMIKVVKNELKGFQWDIFNRTNLFFDTAELKTLVLFIPKQEHAYE